MKIVRIKWDTDGDQEVFDSLPDFQKKTIQKMESSIKTLCGMISQTGCLIPMSSVMVDLR